MIRQILSSLVCSVVLAGCGGGGGDTPAPPAASAPAEPAVKATSAHIVFMGDSITAHWDETAYASPLLSARITGELNVGVSGQTSAQMLARFETDVLAHSPAIVVIEAGINDIGHDATIGVTPNTSAISEMAEKASAAGARVVICAMPNAAPISWSAAELAQIAPLNAQLKQLASAYGYGFADYYTATSVNGVQASAMFESDLTHPNATGYDAMWPALKAAIESLN